jgi:sortase A
MDEKISGQSKYLVIASTPVFDLPPATPLPTFTPTPIPTATPLPLPATRISIPAIQLNSKIIELFPTEKRFVGSESNFMWKPAAFAVGHYETSGNPSEGGNIILAGHNNTLGEVFRDLNKLIPGDEIILFTDIEEFHYLVEGKYLIPYLGVEKEGDVQLQLYAAPQPTEMVTLISCWPYATNSHRIIIRAVPATEGE